MRNRTPYILCLATAFSLSCAPIDRDTTSQIAKSTESNPATLEPGSFQRQSKDGDTWIKRSSTKQAEKIDQDSKCLLKKGKKITVQAFKETKDQHIKIAFEGLEDCPFKEGYVYASHLSIAMMKEKSMLKINDQMLIKIASKNELEHYIKSKPMSEDQVKMMKDPEMVDKIWVDFAKTAGLFVLEIGVEAVISKYLGKGFGRASRSARTAGTLAR